MKKQILIILLVLISFRAFSQENMITLSGGYAFANIEDSDDKGTGFSIKGNFEFNPLAGHLAHGITFGFVRLRTTEIDGLQEIEKTISSFPVYYAPKYMLGNDRMKAFIKGAIGLQYADLKREGIVTTSDVDFGFYGGGGAGIMVFLTEALFVNGEYEIAWASNSTYKDGWINTFSGGIGFRF
jgi:hypothetical protein